MNNKYIKTIPERRIENNPENKIDISIFNKRSNSKTFQGWLIGKIKQARNDSNQELVFLISEIYNKYKEFESKETFKPEQWRGKSGVKFIEKPNLVIALRYRKKDKDSKPQEIRTELSREAINKVILNINKLDRGKTLKTSQIAELTYNRAWKDIFSDRQTHIKLTEILNYLEYKGDIKYNRSGKVEVLKNE